MGILIKIRLGLLKLFWPSYVDEWKRYHEEYVKKNPINHNLSFTDWMLFQYSEYVYVEE